MKKTTRDVGQGSEEAQGKSGALGNLCEEGFKKNGVRILSKGDRIADAF